MTPKQAWMFTTASLLTFALGPIRADTPATLPPPPAQPVAMNLTGTIQSIDLTNNTVMINDGNGNMRTATISNGSNVYRGGGVVPFSDLKTGDLVTVQVPNPAAAPTTPPTK